MTGFASSGIGSTPIFGAQPATSTGFGGFGSTSLSLAPTTTSTTWSLGQQPSTFGGFGQSQPSTGTFPFGQQPQQQQQTGSIFAGFGASQPQQQQPSLFGPQPTQQPLGGQAGQVAPPGQGSVNLEEILIHPKIFNDERDQVLGQLNDVQSHYGSGKAILSQNGVNVQQVDVASTFPSRNRFKAIAYSELNKEELENKIGIIVKYESEVNLKAAILAYEHSLKTLVFQNHLVKVETIKILPERISGTQRVKSCLLSISVTDPNTHRKMVASQLLPHLSAPLQRNSLNTALQNNFLQLMPLSVLSRQELEEYLAKPPSGLDPFLWSQAKQNNPDPSRFIPVPLVGFSSLNDRFKLEEQEVVQQNQRIRMITDSITTLEKAVEATKAKLEECKRRNIPLKGKVLRLMTYHEVTRMRGIPIQSHEDALRSRLEKINLELNAPTKFRGCLNELISRVRQMQATQKGQSVSSSIPGKTSLTNKAIVPSVSYVTSGDVDSDTLLELKAHLKRESTAIQHLLDVLREDQAVLSARVQKSSSATTIPTAPPSSPGSGGGGGNVIFTSTGV